MLGKCLKYDIKAILKPWIIATAILLTMTPIGAICASHIEDEMENPNSFPWPALGLILFIMCIVAYSVFMTIIVYVRYYKHFFSDEGYLTFTLPVKRKTLYTSKLINALIWEAVTGTILAISLIILFAFIPDKEGSMLSSMLASIKEFFSVISSFYEVLILLLVALLAKLSQILTIVAIQLLVTFASVIVKRAKVVVAIAIGYGMSYVLVILVMLVGLFIGIIDANGEAIFVNNFSHPMLIVATALIFACALVAFLTVCMILLSIRLLEKRLNLA